MQVRRTALTNRLLGKLSSIINSRALTSRSFEILALCVVLLLPSCASQSNSALPFLKKEKVNIAVQGETSIRKALREELEYQRKNNATLKKNTFANHQARIESKLLKSYLQSQAYFDGRVYFSIKDKEIFYTVKTGKIYRVERVRTQLPDAISVPDGIITIKGGDALKAKPVLESQKALQRYIAERYCFYRIKLKYRAEIIESTKQAQVIFEMEDSPQVKFGEFSISGLESIKEDYLRRRLPVESGKCFKRGLIDDIRLSLIQTNLVAGVNAKVSEPVDDRVNINLEVVERAHRTVSAGLGYRSDEGAGISLGWTHRNLFGEAENLDINTTFAENRKNISTELTLPHFRRDNQTIIFYSEIEESSTDAYQSEEFKIGSEVSRKITRRLLGKLGLELALSEVGDEGDSQDFALLSMPFTLEFDNRNDELDPHSGWLGTVTTRPFWDVGDAGGKFVKTSFAASAYYSKKDWMLRPTVAFRGAVGSIEGAAREKVPENVRYYVGGGGSVRGYPFQSLGPMVDGEPDGGLSFTETAFELRLRIKENWGVVAFLDGGYAYQGTTPQIDEQLQWGAGLGLRYYTSFAPIRVDVGVPLDKPEFIEDSFQLYISIGQAF